MRNRFNRLPANLQRGDGLLSRDARKVIEELIEREAILKTTKQAANRNSRADKNGLTPHDSGSTCATGGFTVSILCLVNHFLSAEPSVGSRLRQRRAPLPSASGWSRRGTGGNGKGCS